MQTKIFVDEEAKVVACRVYEIVDKWTDMKGEKHIETEPLVSAKVTCKEDDVFDVEKGKQMAYARAMIKAHEKLIRRASRHIKDCQKYIKEWEDEIQHSQSVLEYYDKEYKELAE